MEDRRTVISLVCLLLFTYYCFFRRWQLACSRNQKDLEKIEYRAMFKDVDHTISCSLFLVKSRLAQQLIALPVSSRCA